MALSERIEILLKLIILDLLLRRKIEGNFASFCQLVDARESFLGGDDSKIAQFHNKERFIDF